MKVLSKKMNSPIWNYFNPDPNDASKAICKILKDKTKQEPCNQKYSRGGKDPSKFTNKNLKSHLEKQHPNEYKELSMKEKRLAEKKETRPAGQLTLLRNSVSEAELTLAITKLFIKDGRPFSMVEEEGFRCLMKLLQPSYKIPHRTFFSKTQIPLLFNKTKAKMLSIIKFQNPRYFAFTLDCWKSNADDHYMALTTNFIDENLKKQNILLEAMIFDKERQTAEEISKKIENC